MCGIFGFVGNEPAQDIVVGGLRRLEYRGYDSSGVASIYQGQLHVTRAAGKIRELQAQLRLRPMKGTCMIGHTRWATHGMTCESNAHPHIGHLKRFAIVHNGIIENHDKLRKEAIAQGVSFVSNTDTEVIVNLFEQLHEGNIISTFAKVIEKLEGSYAIAILHVDSPETIYAYAKASPMIVGLHSKDSPMGVVGSDLHALAGLSEEVMFLKEGEIAVVTAGHLQIFDPKGKRLAVRLQPIGLHIENVSKGKFAHYMIKEIFDQPDVLRACLAGRYCEENFTGLFSEIKLDKALLRRIQRIQIVACGSSYHAGLLGASFMEEWARIPCDVAIASEFRYKNPVIVDDTLVIAISQSGETVDTLAAINELKAKGVHIVGLCNVVGSTLDREVDSSIALRCGPEISVASTKTFTAQVVVLALLSLMMARLRDMERERGRVIVEALLKIPQQIEEIFKQVSTIEDLSNKYVDMSSVFFIGRRYMYPVALEGALKLKEIASINATGYPAGELKHGAMALVTPECSSVAFCAGYQVYEKMLSNIAEIKARHGKIIAIGDSMQNRLDEVADHIFLQPATLEPLASILSSVVAQLFAYYIASKKGLDVDQPRNLAKSVTVE